MRLAEFFGALFILVGSLTTLFAGGCTLIGVVVSLFSGGLGDVIGMLVMVLITGGIPFLIGWGLIKAGKSLRGK